MILSVAQKLVEMLRTAISSITLMTMGLHNAMDLSIVKAMALRVALSVTWEKRIVTVSRTQNTSKRAIIRIFNPLLYLTLSKHFSKCSLWCYWQVWRCSCASILHSESWRVLPDLQELCGWCLQVVQLQHEYRPVWITQQLSFLRQSLYWLYWWKCSLWNSLWRTWW